MFLRVPLSLFQAFFCSTLPFPNTTLKIHLPSSPAHPITSPHFTTSSRCHGIHTDQANLRVVHVRDAFATFPADLLPPSYTFHMPMQTSPWGRWYDVDWLRATLSSPDLVVGGGLEDVQVEALASTWPVAGVDDFMRAYGTMVDFVADMVLGAESVGRLGGHEGVRERVREYLVGKFGRRGDGEKEEEGWTLVGLSICAWGRKRAQ